MKKYFIAYFLLNLFLIQEVISQKIETYKGKYEDGNAEYEYYENENLERIFNGKFIFSIDNNSLVTGQYSNNIRVGNWKMKIVTYNQQSGTIMSIDKCYGSYVDGKKNGVWTYEIDDALENNNVKNVFKINFKNDTIVGKLDFTNYSKTLQISFVELKGEFDENGLMTGLWEIVNEKDKDVVIEFHKGYLVKYYIRNKEDGYFHEKFLPNKELLISKIDELISSKIYIPNLKKATSYKEYDRDIHEMEFGAIIFSNINYYLELALSSTLSIYNQNYIPYEKINNYYYNKPLILFQKINDERISLSKAFMPELLKE